MRSWASSARSTRTRHGGTAHSDPTRRAFRRSALGYLVTMKLVTMKRITAGSYGWQMNDDEKVCTVDFAEYWDGSGESIKICQAFGSETYSLRTHQGVNVEGGIEEWSIAGAEVRLILTAAAAKALGVYEGYVVTLSDAPDPNDYNLVRLTEMIGISPRIEATAQQHAPLLEQDSVGPLSSDGFTAYAVGFRRDRSIGVDYLVLAEDDQQSGRTLEVSRSHDPEPDEAYCLVLDAGPNEYECVASWKVSGPALTINLTSAGARTLGAHTLKIMLADPKAQAPTARAMRRLVDNGPKLFDFTIVSRRGG